MNCKVGILIPPSGGNFAGIERVSVGLAVGLTRVRPEWEIHLVLGETYEHLPVLPAAIKQHELRVSRLRSMLTPLRRYFKTYAPDVLFVPQVPATLVSLAARAMARAHGHVVSTVHGNPDIEARRPMDRYLYLLARHTYRQVAGVVAVSHGNGAAMRSKLRNYNGVFETIYNPVVGPEWIKAAQDEPNHPWLSDPTTPVVLGVGRLSFQKDFHMLVRAFKLVRLRRQCRLIILGEGEDRPSLENLVRELGLENDVSLPGYVPNPGSYMRKAAIFALSSRWEGLPTVLIEAMALGTPVVSTDCPFGPAEILETGTLGHVVPVGDIHAMADALLHLLDNPTTESGRQRLKAKSETFTVERAAEAYAQVVERIMG